MGTFERSKLPDPAGYFDNEGLMLKGSGKWKSTMCVFHSERSPSLRINTETGAWACMGCGAKGGDVLAFYMERHGLGFVEAAKALGAWIDDDKPYDGPRRARRLAAGDALELLYFDSHLIWVAGANVANGVALTEQDRSSIGDAVRRISLICEESRP